ncbi:DUF4190 domain-containing protein [Arthrobacter sp. PAMC25284]|uniref:DUF4190 domain-containing protein n=1 Tax=Arthrobacter sp. PAMC25284 TaxID=2861279 RepID=UPI001C62A2C5|nr:DUF4190 domain-containing protein [Arthrobacter sp. PAMC25284]QYF88499.1 DUF4190 domain-containing protein [Arthrobacter sp. PAMC25284]
MRLEAWHVIIIVLLVAAFTIVLAVKRSQSAAGSKVNAGSIGYAPSGEPIHQQHPAGTNTFAILALIFGLLIGLLGIIFGHIARAQIKQTGQAGSGLALTGLILGYGWLALVLGAGFFLAS